MNIHSVTTLSLMGVAVCQPGLKTPQPVLPYVARVLAQ